jgi:hypothetical protein
MSLHSIKTSDKNIARQHLSFGLIHTVFIGNPHHKVIYGPFISMQTGKEVPE